MKKIEITAGGLTAIVLISEALEKDAEKLQALWLIAPKGTDADVWLKNTDAEVYAETAKAILVCAPGTADSAYYTDTLWDALHQQFPALSAAPRDHRLLGVGESAERCLKYAFCYPDRFQVVVAVSPTSSDENAELLAAVQAYMATGRDWPRAVISDCPEGEGRQTGETINAFGVGLHVHGERPVSGWELMDAEIKSCLAHL